MKKPELLAPAGSFETLEAAVMCGADAVYLGGNKFGARAFATNFNNDEMIKAVNYAHLYGVKIYVTVNTLIYDEEVESFLEHITFLDSIGVDAFIIQDLGMMHLLSSIYPHLELHASTQMHIHNLESLLKLKELGIKRVVLPRELSILKIKELKRNSNMEIEIFIHGALCVSYSGQCLMSYLIGGRSGNRGECAGSCRLPYQLIEKEGSKEKVIETNGDYLLSTKDLYTLENISDIIDAGVDSLKIEGRMKRPEYVAVVTSLYRKAIDSYCDGKEYRVTEQDITDLKKMFNRGFTKGYLFGNKNRELMNSIRPNHMGVYIGKVINVDKKRVTIKLTDDIAIGDGIRIVSKKDVGFTITKIYKNNEVVKEAFKGDTVSFDNDELVNTGDEVLKTTDIKLIDKLQTLYKNNNRKVDISVFVSAKINSYFSITVKDGTNSVTATSDVKLSEAKTAPVTKEVIEEKIKKIGDTPYIVKDIIFDIDDNIFMPLTTINALKREALDELSHLRLKRNGNQVVKKYDLCMPDNTQDKIMYKAKVKTKEQYTACIDAGIDQIYIEDLILYRELKDDKRVVLVYPRVRKHKANSLDNVVVNDLGIVTSSTITDYALNVVNSYTVAFLHSLGARTITLSYEMDDQRISNMIKTYKKHYGVMPNIEVIVYGRIEAMITEYCPLNTYFSKDSKCSQCKSKSKYYLRDRFHNDYVLTFDNCLMSIYNYQKRNLINKISSMVNIGVHNFRLNFVDESYEECINIIKQIKKR